MTRRVFALTLTLALVLVLMALLAASAPLHALAGARYVAPTGADAGLCIAPMAPCRTLQYAVGRAANGDTIKLEGGVYADVNGTGGTQQIAYVFAKTLTIEGGYARGFATPPDPIANPTALDAGMQGRVFRIVGGAQVVVEGVRITGGLADDAWELPNGGGLSVEQAAVTLRRCELAGNRAINYTYGSALAALQSTVVVENSRVTGNQASAHGGGALYLEDSEGTFRHTAITTNTASLSGAGAFVLDSNVTFEDCHIVANTAEYDGGGLFVFGSRAAIRHTTIAGNVSNPPGNMQDGGGGLHASRSAVELDGNTIADNTTTAYGGGLHISTGCVVTLTANLIAGNTADGGGGIIGTWSTATLEANRIISNTAMWGGGLELTDAPVVMRGNVVAHNTAWYEYGYGGGAILNNAPATLVNNLIADNSTPGDGAGLYLSSCPAGLAHTTIADNAGLSGVYVTGSYNPPWGPSTLTLSNTIVAGHDLGIKAEGQSTVTLEATLWDNGTDWQGNVFAGAINVWGNPGFRNRAAGDYHLAAGSPALDRGIAAGIGLDIDRQPRPYQAPDLGADEYWPPGALKPAYLPVLVRGLGGR